MLFDKRIAGDFFSFLENKRMIIYFVFVKIFYTLLYHVLWNHHKMAKKMYCRKWWC